MTEGINPLGFLESKIDTEITLLKQIATSLGNAPLTTVNGFSMPFQFVQIDLTVINTQKVINCPVNPVNWIQAISDGALDGITLWLDNPGTTAISLKDLPTIQTNGTTLKQVYLTNDVRSGRSYLNLYFSQTTNPLEFNFGGQDISLSELAAREGSINTFDRRGNVLWLDNFDNGFQAWSYSENNGGSVCVSSDWPINGQVGMKLMTGPVASNYVSIQRYDAYSSLSRIGGQIAFTVDPGMVPLQGQYDLIVGFLNGTRQYTAKLRYDASAGTLSYYNAAGTYTVINPSIVLNNAIMHRVKLVIDLNTQTYVRVLLDNQNINLASIPLYSAANTASPLVALQFTLTATQASPVIAYVGEAILTQNEP